MYELLKVVVSSLFMPIPFVLVLIILGLLFITWHFKKIGIAFIATGGICLFLFSWAPFADRVLAPYERQYSAFQVDISQPVGYVVVLGGGWYPEDNVSSSAKLSESSLFRVNEGVRIWRQFPNAKLVVSGASRYATIEPVAKGYFQAALDLGVPNESMVVLDTPTDTAKESKAFKNWIEKEQRQPGLVVLVTSASHMPRAMSYFQAQALNPVAAPTHFLVQPEYKTFKRWIPSATHLRKTERAWYEFLASFAVKYEH